MRAVVVTSVFALAVAGCGDSGSGADNSSAGNAGAGGGVGTAASGGQAAGGTAAGGSGAGGASGGTSGAGGAAQREVNEPPTARGETAYTTPGVAVTLPDLLANDVDPDGDALTVTLTSQPAHGTLSSAGGSYVYTPGAGFVGEDSFGYSVTDAFGAADQTEVFIYAANHIYYVSPSGDDGASGLSPSAAWKSPNVFCGGKVKRGDVVLLERGATFRTKLTVCDPSGGSALPTVLGAYGSGESPIIAGSDLVQGWTKVAGNTWRASVAEEVKGLFFNGEWQPPARTPNAGFATTGENIAGGAGSVQIKTPSLSGGANAYAGATLRIRTSNWSYENRKVTASSNGQLTIDSATSFDVSDGGWGYFLDGKLEFLDAPGEWFYDAGARTLYFNAPGDVEPATGVSEAVVRDDAIRLYNNAGVDSGFVFDGVTAAQAYDSAISLAYLNHNVTLRRVTARDSYKGIAAWMDDVDVVESTISGTLDEGARFGGKNARLLRSAVRDIALHPGYGAERWGYLGLVFQGDNFVMRHNVVDGVGYIGVTGGGADGLIEENLVQHSMAVLNDGGSIAFDHCDGLTIKKNIVTDPIGDFAESVSPAAGPWKAPYQAILFGIYFGNTSIKDTLVEGNVATKHNAGVIVDHTLNSAGSAVKDNLLFGNTDSQLYALDQSAASCQQTYDQRFTGNRMVPTGPEQRLYQTLDVKCQTPVVWATSDDNLFATLYASMSAAVVRKSLPNSSVNQEFSLAEWQAASGQDANSAETPATLTLPDGAEPVLFYNAARGPRVINPAGAWLGLDGGDLTGPLTIPPYSAIVLIPK